VTAAALRRPGGAELRIGAILLAVTAAAWALTADRMAGMDAGPGAELGGLGWFAVSWLVMMAAMMLPALAPMVVEHGRRAAHAGAAPLFAAGYLATWLAAGLAGYAAIEGVRSLDPGFLAWDEAGRYVAAGAIAAAGLYQLSAPKGVCLRRCRERAAFLRDRWRPGRLGALSW
jgi:predicted metal-binding membrane protein